MVIVEINQKRKVKNVVTEEWIKRQCLFVVLNMQLITIYVIQGITTRVSHYI